MADLNKLTDWEQVNQAVYQHFTKEPITIAGPNTSVAELGRNYFIDLDLGDVTQTLPAVTLDDVGKIISQVICCVGDGTFFTNYADNNNAIDGLGTTITADGRDSRWLMVANVQGQAKYVGLNYANLDQIKIFDVTASGDDAGVNVEGELSVGKPNQPKEFISGEGDSYPAIYAFHYDEANRTGDTITSATDVTSILQSDSGSTVGMFDGLTAGKSLLIGGIESHRWGGIKVKVNTAGSITYASGEVDNYELKRLESSANWVDGTLMTRQDIFPKTRTNRQIASTSNSISEQVNFGFPADEIPITWDDVTLNINGTNYTTKWYRITLTAPITTDPIIEQVKCHTDRIEVTESGVERYGKSRNTMPLRSDTYANTNRNPPNENIALAPNFTLLVTDNEFADGAIDGRIAITKVPQSLDTSVPLLVTIEYYVKGTGTGDVVWNFSKMRIPIGDPLNGTKTIDETKEVITNVATNAGDNELRSFQIQIDPTDSMTDELLMLGVDRIGNDANDTLVGNIVLVAVLFDGTFWE